MYNLISRSLGFPQVKQSHAHSLDGVSESIPFDFFSPVRGNMLFSVEGISSGTLPAGAVAFGSTPTYTLKHTSRPYHPLSVLATVTSGTQPRKHGIVNERSVTPTSANLFDVAKALHPESRVVSGSSSKSHAQVLSAHKGSDNYFWDQKTGAFLSLSEVAPTIVVNKDNILTHLSALGSAQAIEYQSGVVASIGGIKYDVNDENDNTLFAEVAFVSAWTSYLEKDSTSQSFFSFHFASLGLIEAKYGRSSPQWLKAFSLIDLVLSRALVNNFVFEIIYLPTVSTVQTKAIESIVTPIVASYLDQSFFPHIYLTAEGKTKQEELCQEIKHKLSEDFSSITVFCTVDHGHKKRAEEDPVLPWAELLPTEADVLALHYVLWTFLILIAALIWGVIALATIPPDVSLLTASTFYKKGPKMI